MHRLLILCGLVALTSCQNGYDYQQPQNPLPSPSNGREGVKSEGVNGGGGGGGEHHHSSDDPLQWLRDSVPGEPGVDYPILGEMPETSFTCDDKVSGYYADPEAGCQPFHVCNEMLGGQMMKISFLCPNGTIFNQEGFACQWWNQVDCAASEQFYSKNEEIGVVPESAASNGQSNVASQGQNGGNGGYQQPQQGSSRPQNGGNGGYQQPQQGRPQNGNGQSQQPQPAPSRPQNSYQQPQQQQQQPQRSRPQPQPQRSRPQPQPQRNSPQPQRNSPQPQSQRRRPQPQRSQNGGQNNQYVPPSSGSVQQPPALYGLPN